MHELLSVWQKLKKYALFKKIVDNTIILVYYSTSAAVQKS